MSSATDVPVSSRRPRPAAGILLTVVNGVLAGIGSVYASTHSTLITIIAGVMAVALATAILILQR